LTRFGHRILRRMDASPFSYSVSGTILGALSARLAGAERARGCKGQRHRKLSADL